MKLVIKNVSKTYGKVRALKDASFELREGIYGLLGPNGAGKSTLINLLTDNIKRDSGEILLDGTDILAMKGEYLNYVGYMPQDQGYYEEFTVKAFLMYIARLKGLKAKAAKDRAEELIDMFNMGYYCHKKVGSLSGGMRQRVLLAQALLNDPPILILDEPTAGVDPQERINIRNSISKLAENRIIIIATHIVSDIEAIANEILLMKDGVIIEKDTPYNLINKVRPKVYCFDIPKSELDYVQQTYSISNIQHTMDGYSIKIVCDDYDGRYEERDVEANLEDVYLYYF